MTGSKLFPADVRQFIEDNHKGICHQQMADMVNTIFGTSYTRMQIKSYYQRFKLNSGLTGRFMKGSVPYNKGKHTGGGPAHTLFQKGHIPYNTYLPVGSEVIDSDGYRKIKVADPNKWKFVHRLIWENANGPIPAGHALIFADGDRRNISLDNLLLITKAQLVRMNQQRLITNNAELTKTGVVIADIINRIGSRRRAERSKRKAAAGTDGQITKYPPTL